MFGFLGFRNKCPPKVATDVVVPLHWFEDGWIWKSIVAYSFFVVDDQLDVIKMKAALEGLVERKGYRKLGGRLRQGVSETFIHYMRLADPTDELYATRTMAVLSTIYRPNSVLTDRL